jgi:hypothetical protein
VLPGGQRGFLSSTTLEGSDFDVDRNVIRGGSDRAERNRAEADKPIPSTALGDGPGCRRFKTSPPKADRSRRRSSNVGTFARASPGRDAPGEVRGLASPGPPGPINTPGASRAGHSRPLPPEPVSL